ncbi:hypothetical protein EC912_101471 [Luteibacter rhizovicinus]|uniref:DUF7931 domain-containing protein n=1 Tax=Luteibacter rhizovicinus TaxID=242606 RepID=A0A4V2W4W5_9GAMM|nr:hypothetical protein [Luteibacter rhizovicinus]TCV97459.1 hypothetical protein EC912_101471 [Luteibacter rhizovicinus]
MSPADDAVLAAGDRASLDLAHQRLLDRTRHRLCIYLPILEGGVLESEAILTSVRRIATSGRRASIRILTHDAVRALRESHRLILLAQRLPSAIAIRVPTEEADLRYPSAFVTDNASGFLFRPLASRYEARGHLDALGEASHLQGYFDEVWERSEAAWEIRPLGI